MRSISIQKIVPTLSIICIIIIAGCTGTHYEGDTSGKSSTQKSAEGIIYNRFNIHYYKKSNARTGNIERIASYANYIDPPNHRMIPYNTPLTIRIYKRGFTIFLPEADEEILFEYNRTNMDGMTVREYLDLITSIKKVDYSHFSPLDQQGIAKGQPLPGMSRDGIMVALGYPARHRTPSLDEDTWVYWKDRFRIMKIQFSEGKVSEIID